MNPFAFSFVKMHCIPVQKTAPRKTNTFHIMQAYEISHGIIHLIALVIIIEQESAVSEIREVRKQCTAMPVIVYIKCCAIMIVYKRAVCGLYNTTGSAKPNGSVIISYANNRMLYDTVINGYPSLVCQ